VEAITVDSWVEAYEKLSEHGWAVVNNYVDLIQPASRPDSDMRDYILDCTLATYEMIFKLFCCALTQICIYSSAVPEDCRETIFEGAVVLKYTVPVN
jgi:hypothetical protein